jgi:hypothetical protein
LAAERKFAVDDGAAQEVLGELTLVFRLGALARRPFEQRLELGLERRDLLKEVGAIALWGAFTRFRVCDRRVGRRVVRPSR